MSSPKIGLHENSRTPSDLWTHFDDLSDKQPQGFDIANSDEAARCCISRRSV